MLIYCDNRYMCSGNTLLWLTYSILQYNLELRKVRLIHSILL